MSERAIIAALEREVAPLLQNTTAVRKEHAGRTFTFYEQPPHVIVCGGIGAEPARRAAEAAISFYHPVVLHSVGFAGALVPHFRVGDVFEPSTVIDARDGSRLEAGGDGGALLTFGSVTGVAQKASLAQAYGALAVDMEASAVGAAACAHGLQFRATKVISDDFDFEMPDFNRFTTPQGGFSTRRFVLFTVVRPWLWRRVFTLARNSGKASKALALHLAGEAFESRSSAEAGTL